MDFVEHARLVSYRVAFDRSQNPGVAARLTSASSVESSSPQAAGAKQLRTRNPQIRDH